MCPPIFFNVSTVIRSGFGSIEMYLSTFEEVGAEVLEEVLVNRR